MKNIIISLLLGCTFLPISLANEWQIIDIEPLNDPDTTNKTHPFIALLSGDGKTIITSFMSHRNRSACITYQWSKDKGYEKLGDFCAHKVSYDGQTIYGSTEIFSPKTDTSTYYWTRELGLTSLTTNKTDDKVVIMDMDDAGTTFVGHIWQDNCTIQEAWPMKAFVYRNGVMEYLEPGTRAISVSNDGTTVLVQKNKWMPDDLCPVRFNRYGYTPYAMTLDHFMGELYFDSSQSSSTGYLKKQSGIKYKKKKTPPKAIDTGLWKKDVAKVQWIGQKYPIELSNDGQRVILRSYQSSEYYTKPNNTVFDFSFYPWPFLMWDRGNITMTGWFTKSQASFKPYFLGNNELPKGMGFFITTEEDQKKQTGRYRDSMVDKSRGYCSEMGPSSKKAEVAFCFQKSTGYGPTLIFEGSQKGMELREWATKHNIQTEIKFYDVQTVIRSVSDDGNVWLGAEQYQASSKAPRLFILEYKAAQ